VVTKPEKVAGNKSHEHMYIQRANTQVAAAVVAAAAAAAAEQGVACARMPTPPRKNNT
jgi:hypothetical protein